LRPPVSEFNQQGFENFLAGLSDNLKNDESIQELLRFYCLHGVKENELSAILGFYLQSYSRKNTQKFTVIVNSSLPKNDGIISFPLPEKPKWQFTTIDNSDKGIIKKILGKTPPRADLQIFNLNKDPKHIIEFKSDRRLWYLSELHKSNSKLHKNLIGDLKFLATLQAFSMYKETSCWQGVITYSFQEVGEQFPNNFPKYNLDEHKKKLRVPEIRNEEDEKTWFKICDKELEKLIDQLKALIRSQDYLVHTEKIATIGLAKGIVNLHSSAEESGARVLVQSELLIFEVKANEKYLDRIRPQIIELQKKSAIRGN